MPKERKPNHDALGNSLAGQEVNFDASTGDSIVIGGYTWHVRDTYPAGVYITRNGQEQTKTYRELRRLGAFYAAV